MPARIYIVQICNVFGDSVYLPLAAGMLRAQARAQPDLRAHYQFEPLLHERFDLEETSERIVDPAVVGLSTYVWNWEYSIELARRIRALYPDVQIVVGGPQVPNDCSEVFADGVVDIAVHGEGEVTFTELLRALGRGEPLDGVSGISFRENGRTTRTAARERVKNLDELASPFLDGDFESLMDGPRRLIGLWETNRGCPFGCTFCYWGSAINQRVREFEMPRLERELDWFVDHEIDYVLCADANFGIRRRDADIARRVRDAKKTRGHPRKFRIFSTKNASKKVLEVVEILHEAGLDQGLSLTMQSLSADTLDAIGRKNIKLSTYIELGREARRRGLVSYSDLIVGLPGETYDSFVEGLDRLLEVGQHDNVHVYSCTLLVGSEMADPDYSERHGIVTARNPILERHMRADAIDTASVTEYEDVVIGTRTMPVSDWIETNLATVFFNLLHFQKLANWVAIYLRHAYGIRYRRFFEGTMRAAREPGKLPLLGEAAAFAHDYYLSLTKGRANRLVLEAYGDVIWPIEEAAFLLLSRDFDGVYAEIRRAALEIARQDGVTLDEAALDDLLAYQAAQTPRPDGPPSPVVRFNHDWPRWFRRALDGKTPEPPSHRALEFRVVNQHETDGSLESYARAVAWYARSAADIQYRFEANERRGASLPVLGSAGSA